MAPSGAFCFLSEDGAHKLLCVRGELKGAGIFLFSEAKAKIPSRGREKFLSGNLLVTNPPSPLSVDFLNFCYKFEINTVSTKNTIEI
jgi:hypothetical protein